MEINNELASAYKSFVETRSTLTKEEVLSEARRLLGLIRDAGRYVSDPQERDLLAAWSRDIGDTIYKTTGEYPTVRIAPPEILRTPLSFPYDTTSLDRRFVLVLATITLVWFPISAIAAGVALYYLAGIGALLIYFAFILAFFFAVSMTALYALIARLRLRYPVPFDCAVLVERMGKPKVLWGSSPFLWPLDKVQAIVPLRPLRYTSPKQEIVLSTDEAVEISLAMYYGVNFSGYNAESAENVLKAVYRIQEGTAAESQQASKNKIAAKTIVDLKPAWEKRLLFDIVMTLNEVLPGKSFDDLFSNQDIQRVKICTWLRRRLEERTKEWGIGIEELSIVELDKARI